MKGRRDVLLQASQDYPTYDSDNKMVEKIRETLQRHISIVPKN